jgi:hypothetical protein
MYVIFLVRIIALEGPQIGEEAGELPHDTVFHVETRALGVTFEVDGEVS